MNTDLDYIESELKQTTVGYKNSKWTVPPVGTHWANALERLASLYTTTPMPTSAAWAWDAQAAVKDPNSDALIASFIATQLHYPNLAISGYAVATCITKSDSPGYKISLIQGGKVDDLVYIPLDSKPDPQGDRHLTIYDAIHGRETDLWQANYDTSSGRITSASAGISFPLGSVNEQTYGYGGNAANVPLRQGLVTPSDMSNKKITHTLVCGMPYIGGTSTSYKYPALHNAPTGPVTNMPEGTFLRLKGSVDVPSLSITNWEKVIAQGLKDHGMILRDNSGTFAIYAENRINQGGLADWQPAGLVPAGSSYSIGFSSAFPWNQLEVLMPPSH